ncbi:MAG: hypothetical protein L6R40_005192 [Gallowayella cf. fulva]|nr:MAG: hypothetical protein L6R40_005192 [Xanthomendoza cf. fulva]
MSAPQTQNDPSTTIHSHNTNCNISKPTSHQNSHTSFFGPNSIMSYKLTSASPSQPSLPTSPSPSDKFTLHTPPNTDIWRKPHPLTDTFNAPRYLTTIPLKELKSVQVTVKGRWKTLYDQGGLLLILPSPAATAAAEAGEYRSKWIKTGIEFYNGKPHISAVACDRWADWSLLPLPSPSTEEVAIRMDREVKNGEKTSTLWITYQNPQSGAWMPIREIAWGFEEDEGDARIGVYAAKPTADEDDDDDDGELEVEFTRFEVQRW